MNALDLLDEPLETGGSLLDLHEGSRLSRDRSDDLGDGGFPATLAVFHGDDGTLGIVKPLPRRLALADGGEDATHSQMIPRLENTSAKRYLLGPQ